MLEPEVAIPLPEAVSGATLRSNCPNCNRVVRMLVDGGGWDRDDRRFLGACVRCCISWSLHISTNYESHDERDGTGTVIKDGSK